MHTYHFTFGQSHMSSYTLPRAGRLADFWVTVEADSFGEARQLFCDHFTQPYCPRPMQWSFQYEDSEFKPEYFPGGQLCLIRKGEGIVKEPFKATHPVDPRD